VLDDPQFVSHTEQLEPGDQIVFYTDGITEAANPDGELFGTDRLDRALAACGAEPAEIVDRILKQVETHTGGTPARDDRTLVVARVV